MTEVSEVETRSIDTPWRAKGSKASARKPEARHMPSVSSVIRRTRFFTETAFRRGVSSDGVAEMVVPVISGLCVHSTCISMP